ncbi:MAG: M48 family peptidase, partial [Bacteroidota bacterium]|nr:M48 family peptidase [Bacteroidota bacterium]
MGFISTELVLYIIIGIIVFDYIFERILDYLNSTYWSDELPEELSDIYEADKYKKSQQYLRVKQRFSILVSSISFIAMILMLLLGGFAFLDQLCRSITLHPILMALLYFGILGLAADILSTPFSIYNTFVIEERFGFNKTTVRTFILDKFKGLFLGLIIGGGLLSLIVWIYTSTGAWFWFIAWIVVSVFMIFMTMFYSNVIVPLFNKQEPLESGELRKAIESYAFRVKFKLKN